MKKPIVFLLILLFSTCEICSAVPRTRGRSGYRGVVSVGASDSSAEVKGYTDYACDGTADNVQINAALVRVAAEGGGTVFLAAGNYSISAEIIVLTNTRLSGAGVGKTIITLADSTNRIMCTNTLKTAGDTDRTDEGGQTNIIVEDLTFEGNLANNPSVSISDYYVGAWYDSGIGLIDLYDVTDVIVQNVAVNNASWSGVEIQACNRVNIDKVSSNNWYDDGISIAALSKNVVVSGFNLYKTDDIAKGGSCIVEVQDGASEVTVIGGTGYSAQDSGIQVSSHADKAACSNVTVTGCTISGCKNGLHIVGDATSVQKNITFTGNVVKSTNTAIVGGIFVQYVEGFVFTGNVIEVYNFGIQFGYDCSYGVVNNNFFICTQAVTVATMGLYTRDFTNMSYVDFCNNIVEGFGYRGVFIDGDGGTYDGAFIGVRIIGNQFLNMSNGSSRVFSIETQGAGNATYDNCVFEGNHYTTPSTGFIISSDAVNDELGAGWGSKDKALWNKRTIAAATETLGADEANKLFIINAASNSVIITLPTATVGLEFVFVVSDATNEFRLDPNASEYIKLANGTKTSAGGDYITNNTAKAAEDGLRIKCRVAGVWEHLESIGTWTEE